MDLSFTLNIVFGLATVASLFLAVKENKEKDRAKAAEQRFREMYQNLCRTKCMTLTGIAQEFSQNTENACLLIGKCSSLAKRGNDSIYCHHAAHLTGFMFSIRTATNQLIKHCKVVNEEYFREFKEPVYENFERDLQVDSCGVFSNIGEHSNANSADAKSRAAD